MGIHRRANAPGAPAGLAGAVSNCAHKYLRSESSLLGVQATQLFGDKIYMSALAQSYSRPAKSATSQTSTEDAGNFSRELYQQVELSRAVLEINA